MNETHDTYARAVGIAELPDAARIRELEGQLRDQRTAASCAYADAANTNALYLNQKALADEAMAAVLLLRAACAPFSEAWLEQRTRNGDYLRAHEALQATDLTVNSADHIAKHGHLRLLSDYRELINRAVRGLKMALPYITSCGTVPTDDRDEVRQIIQELESVQ